MWSWCARRLQRRRTRTCHSTCALPASAELADWGASANLQGCSRTEKLCEQAAQGVTRTRGLTRVSDLGLCVHAVQGMT